MSLQGTSEELGYPGYIVSFRCNGNSLVLSGVCLGDLLDHEHPGVAVVLDLVPAAVLDGLPVEGPRDVRLRVAAHVAHEAHVAVQDLETDDRHESGKVRLVQQVFHWKLNRSESCYKSGWYRFF